MGKKKNKKNKKKFAILPTFGFIGSTLTARDVNKGSLGWWIIQYATGQREPNATNIQYTLDDTLAQYTGYSYLGKNWKFPSALVPLFAGVIGSKIMSKIGANRVLSRIPFIGKHIKF